MRLICGILRLDRRDAEATALDRLVAHFETTARTGQRFTYLDGPLAMAVCDFSDTPGTGVVVSNAVALAADVRIDQPHTLASRLHLETADEPALLLAALSHDGGPADLLGDFAYAAWDSEQGRLTCGRDHFGVRPLSYVHRPDEFFAFASLSGALHGSGLVSRHVDTSVAVRRMLFAMGRDDSPIRGIVRVPPGHVIEVTRNGLSTRQYWQLNRRAFGTARMPYDQAASQLRDLVEQAVRDRLSPGLNAGAHLSGGLDSSAVAILAARAKAQVGERLAAWSFLDRLSNDIHHEDESAYVRACTDQETNFDWIPVRHVRASAPGTMALDADLMSPAERENPEMRVAADAAERGIDIVLSGWGGDEAATFNGTGALAELARRGNWRRAWHEVQALARERGWRTRDVANSQLLSLLVTSRLPRVLHRAIDRMRGKQPTLTETIRSLLRDPVVAEALDDAIPSDGPDGRENRWTRITHPNLPHRLQVWAETGARHGFAYAFPLLDRRVVEFALSLPSEYFIADGFRRRLFRDAMQGVLPDKVRLRHEKFIPFPSIYVEIAESRDAYSSRVEAMETDGHLASVIECQALRAMIAAMPSADAVRSALEKDCEVPGLIQMLAINQVMRLASYLEQHAAPDQPAQKEAHN